MPSAPDNPAACDTQPASPQPAGVATLHYASAESTRPPGFLLRWWLTSPGWLTLLAAAVVLFATLWLARSGGVDFIIALLLGLSWCAVLVLWLARGIVCLTLWLSGRASGRGTLHVPRGPYWRWAATPAVFAAMLVLCTAQAPLHIGFAVSRPAMQRLATSVTAGPPNTTFPDRRVGVYEARGIEPFPGGMRFWVTQVGFGDTLGFAYSPNGPPPDLGEDRYRPLGDGWYHWPQSW